MAAVALIVGLPLARGRGGRAGDGVQAARGAGERARIEELEQRKEQKLAEIREAELDHRTGKLSREDYQQVDADLRAEAVELLRELDRERGR